MIRPVLLGATLSVVLAFPAHAADLPLKGLFPTPLASSDAPVLDPWDGPQWEYLQAPFARYDASLNLASPVSAVSAGAAMIHNAMVGDGVVIKGKVVSLQYVGEHGWELIGVQGGTAYFKRPKKLH